MNQSASELIQQHTARAAEFIAEDAIDSFKWRLPMRIKSLRIDFDSPLEEIFYLWWLAYSETQSNHVESFGCKEILLVHHQIFTTGVERYELDFGLDFNARYRDAIQPIAIELDGHEFHERTRAQVQRRDQRDRALQKAGWKVFHFSFTEFVADPYGCVSEVFDYAADLALKACEDCYSISDEALADAAAHTRI